MYFRFAAMFTVLVGAVALGYLARRKWNVSPDMAASLMTAELTFFHWFITMMIVWNMHLSRDIIMLPIIGGLLLLLCTGVSLAVAGPLKMTYKSKATFVLAGALSNLGYTGGAFVCFAVFGAPGLALAQIYIVFWIIIVYLLFFPVVRRIEKPDNNGRLFALKDMLDPRLLSIPAVIAGLALNFSGLKRPEFIADYYIVDIFVYAASGLSFFAIGLRLSFSRLGDYVPLYFLLGAVKFILTPLMAWLLLVGCGLAGFHLSGLPAKVVLVQSLTPAAVVMVTLSNVFKLDGQMGSALWVVNTAAFVFVVVPVLFLLLLA